MPKAGHFFDLACKYVKGMPIFQLGFLTCQKECQFFNFACHKVWQQSIHHAHHKSCWKTMHHVSWLLNYFTNYSTENMVIRNGKNHSHNKISYNYLIFPTQANHSSGRSQVFFFLFSCFSCGKLEKALVPCKPGLFTLSFLTKEQKRKKYKRRKFHKLFFNMTWSIEI